VEIAIVIFLFAIILLALFNLFDWHGKVFRFQEGQFQVTSSSRAAVNEIQHYTLQAYRVLASRTINGSNYNSGGQTLVLQLPAIDGSGAVLDATWDYAAFYLTGANLYATIQADSASSRPSITTKLLSDTVSALTFTYNSADFNLVNKVTVDITTQKQVRAQLLSDRLQENLYLRNFY
jgi:hypothetical protein